jgi:hypothetical protein
LLAGLEDMPNIRLQGCVKGVIVVTVGANIPRRESDWPEFAGSGSLWAPDSRIQGCWMLAQAVNRQRGIRHGDVESMEETAHIG